VPRDAERSHAAGSQIGRGPLYEGDAALRNRGVDERLTRPQRNVAIAEVEVAREGDLDPLADPECPVRLDVDGDVGGEKREAVGARGTGQRERRDCGKRRDR
jgi:hypothetical protein